MNADHTCALCGYCAACPQCGDKHSVACHDSRGVDIVHEAETLGREAGEAAATWVVFDSLYHAENTITMLQDGDPRVYDEWRTPNLSGEFADSPTPRTLAEELGFPADDEAIDDICTAWEEAASETFWRAVERSAYRVILPTMLEAATTARREAEATWRQLIHDAAGLAELSQRSIAQHAGITQQRVGQILNQ